MQQNSGTETPAEKQLAEPYECAIMWHLCNAAKPGIPQEELVFSLQTALHAYQSLEETMIAKGGTYATYFSRFWQR